MNSRNIAVFFCLQATSDAQKSIASALSTAIGKANGDGDVEASAKAFAVAIAIAYATIISNHYGTVYVDGEDGYACAFTQATGQATATAMSTAVSDAFSHSTNEYAKAAASCFSNAVSIAAVEATQDAEFHTCTDTDNSKSDDDFFKAKLETVGFVKTVSLAFSHVFTAIRDKDPVAAATCIAFGSSVTGVSTTETDYTTSQG